MIFFGNFFLLFVIVPQQYCDQNLKILFVFADGCV